MMDVTKMIIDANMQALYVLNPEGELKERTDALKEKLVQYAASNPGAMDIVGESGLRDEYNALYMEIFSQGGISQEQVLNRIDDIREQYDDKAVQDKIRVQLSAILDALVFGWTDAKDKIHAGHIKMEKYAQAMVIVRKQTKRFCRFLKEDMGVVPEELGSIWSESDDAARYVLAEEILTEKPIEEILLMV